MVKRKCRRECRLMRSIQLADARETSGMFRDSRMSAGIPRSTSADRCILQTGAIMVSEITLSLTFVLFFSFGARRKAIAKGKAKLVKNKIQSVIKAFLTLKAATFGLLRFSARCYGLLHGERLLDFASLVFNNRQSILYSSTLIV